MNTAPKDVNAIRDTFRSSISVSNKVCEDKASISKDVNHTTDTPAEATRSDEDNKKYSGTGMSVGGKEACSEDTCIGKK